MLALLAFSLVYSSPLVGVEDFFPMSVGNRWIYREISGSSQAESTDTVLAAEEVQGVMRTPIITTFSKREVDRAYYAVIQGEVHIVAFVKNNPLTTSYAILKDPTVAKNWKHDGETFMQGAPADMKLSGNVKFGKKEEFDGRLVDTIVVTLDTILLEKSGSPIKSNQVAVYGRGIGLIRSESTFKLKKRTEKATRQLVKYIPNGVQ